VSIGDLGQLTTAEKTNLVGAINEANDRGAYPPYIGANKNWYVWSSATAQYVDSGVTAEGADGICFRMDKVVGNTADSKF